MTTSKHSSDPKPKRRPARSNGPATFCIIPQDHLQALARCEALPARTRVLLAFELLLHQFNDRGGARRVSLADLKEVTGISRHGSVVEARVRLRADGLIIFDQANRQWMFPQPSGPGNADTLSGVKAARTSPGNADELPVREQRTSKAAQVVREMRTPPGPGNADTLRGYIRTSQEPDDSKNRQEAPVRLSEDDIDRQVESITLEDVDAFDAEDNADASLAETFDDPTAAEKTRDLVAPRPVFAVADRPAWLEGDQPSEVVLADPVLLAAWRKRHPLAESVA